MQLNAKALRRAHELGCNAHVRHARAARTPWTSPSGPPNVPPYAAGPPRLCIIVERAVRLGGAAAVRGVRVGGQARCGVLRPHRRAAPLPHLPRPGRGPGRIGHAGCVAATGKGTLGGTPPTDARSLASAVAPEGAGAATELSEEAFTTPIPTVATVSAAAPQPALTVHTAHCASVELDVLFRTMYSMLLLSATTSGATGRGLSVAEEDDEDDITAGYVTLDRAGVAVPARRTSTARALEAESPSTRTGSLRAAGPARSASRRDVTAARRSGALARSPAEAPSTARAVRTMAAQTTHLLQLLRTLLTPSAAEGAQARPESLALFFLAFLGRLATFTGDWTGVLVAVRDAGQTRSASMQSLRARAEPPDPTAARCVGTPAGPRAAGRAVLHVAVLSTARGLPVCRTRGTAAAERAGARRAARLAIGQPANPAGRKSGQPPQRARGQRAHRGRGAPSSRLLGEGGLVESRAHCDWVCPMATDPTARVVAGQPAAAPASGRAAVADACQGADPADGADGQGPGSALLHASCCARGRALTCCHNARATCPLAVHIGPAAGRDCGRPAGARGRAVGRAWGRAALSDGRAGRPPVHVCGAASDEGRRAAIGRRCEDTADVKTYWQKSEAARPRGLDRQVLLKHVADQVPAVSDFALQRYMRMLQAVAANKGVTPNAWSPKVRTQTQLIACRPAVPGARRQPYLIGALPTTSSPAPSVCCWRRCRSALRTPTSSRFWCDSRHACSPSCAAVAEAKADRRRPRPAGALSPVRVTSSPCSGPSATCWACIDGKCNAVHLRRRSESHCPPPRLIEIAVQSSVLPCPRQCSFKRASSPPFCAGCAFTVPPTSSARCVLAMYLCRPPQSGPGRSRVHGVDVAPDNARRSWRSPPYGC